MTGSDKVRKQKEVNGALWVEVSAKARPVSRGCEMGHRGETGALTIRGVISTFFPSRF